MCQHKNYVKGLKQQSVSMIFKHIYQDKSCAPIPEKNSKSEMAQMKALHHMIPEQQMKPNKGEYWIVVEPE